MATPQMTYFRRPLLSGQNMKRLSYATVCGSVRRLDADAVSAAPYFPTTAATTLVVDTQTTSSVGTSFAANSSMVAALAALNATLPAANAKAVEQDGCIAIQSTVQGSAGWVRITGGSAATVLGFDVAAGIDLFSRGGDLDSAPQGRVGNTLGTAFPGPKDDLTVGGIQRSLGRLASNSDVLWSELKRQMAVRSVTPLTGTASSGISAYNPLFLSNVQFYNGIGAGLTRTSTGEQILPFFVLQDADSLDILKNKVVSISVGTTLDVPTTTDASHVSDVNGNLLGRNLIIWGPTAIPIGGIKNGQVIKVTNLGLNCAVGNVIGIDSAATNLIPWSNVGIRWVVDQVIDNDTIAVRPMSSSEYSLFNSSSPNEGQPILELNSAISGSQVYGNVTVYTGAFYKGNCVIITSPPLDADQNVNIWVYQPKAIRDLLPGDLAAQENPFYLPNPVFQGRTPNALALVARQSVGGPGTAPIFAVCQSNGSPLIEVNADSSILGILGMKLEVGPTVPVVFMSVSQTGLLSITGNDATTPLTVTGAMSGANGSSNPGLILAATGTNAGIRLKTGATTRWNIDASGNLVNASSGTLQMNGQKITGLGAPTTTNDAATWGYVNTRTKFTLNFGSDFGVLVAGDRYVPFGCLMSGGTPVWNNIIVGGTVPEACVLKSMVLSATALPVGGTELYTVYQISGGVVTSTGMSVTAAPGAGAVLLTATGSVSAAAGDMFCVLRHVVSGTLTTAMSQLGIVLGFSAT